MNEEELEDGEIQLEEEAPVTEDAMSTSPPAPRNRPPTPPRHLLPTNVEITQDDVLSKPIKRREINESEREFSEEVAEDRSFEDTRDFANFSSNKSFKEYEKEAKADLISFLTKKSLDSSWAEFYTINIRAGKQRKDNGRKSGGPGYSVTYANPEGSFLASKSDVLSDIQERMIRKSNKAAGGSVRSKAYEDGKHRLRDLDLPKWYDNIFLLDLGHVDNRSGFFSPVNIYPIGYKCEQSVTGVTVHKGVTEQDVICEIGELDGFPEFRITVKSTGSVLCAFSEAAVWKKFNPGNVDSDWNPSFFNLKVELLIEGLEGSIDCEDYKFHYERGYNEVYFDEKSAKSARKEFLTKYARERRNQDRQKNKFLTKEEIERQAELQRRANLEEKEISKKMKVLEKERKDRGKEEVKKSKEEKKLHELKAKEESKKTQLLDKEQIKVLEKKKKEELKKNEKVKQQLRKDILSDIRKFRADAHSAVLSFFDNEEEDLEEDGAAAIKPEQTNSSPEKRKNLSFSTVSDFLSQTQKELTFPNISIPEDESKMDVAESKKSSQYLQQLSWDDIFYIANTLNIVRPMLGLGRGVNLDELLAGLELNETDNSSSTDDVARKLNLKDDTAMEIDGPQASNESKIAEDEEAEFEVEQARNNNNLSGKEHAREKAIVELEKIELFVTKALTHEIHQIFDLDTKEATSDKKQSGGGGGGNLKFPLNQLTWLELSRMALISYLFTQLERSKEDIQHALRGSKQPSYRIGKNITRNIRYRWYLRHKLAKNKQSTDAKSTGESESFHPEDRLFLLQTVIDGFNAQSLGNFTSLHPDLKQKQLERKASRPLSNYFNNEFEIEDEINKMAADDTVPEIYRRCSKVLLKLLSLTSIKNNFLWEIDQEMYPDYYSLMIRPLMFANVATNLISKSYEISDSTETDTEKFKRIGLEFYEDLRQIVLNCISFSTELPPVVAQAQKLFLIMHRYCSQWIFSPNRPSLEKCNNDAFCLLTHEPIHIAHSAARSDIIKCGKCTGIFNLSSLEDAFLNYKEISNHLHVFQDFFIPPTVEILNSVNEEWHCPFCLHEDYQHLLQSTTATTSSVANFLHDPEKYVNPQDKYFYIDEWGPSVSIPWMLNSNYSNTVKNIIEKQSYLLPILDALYILSDPIYEDDLLASQTPSILRFPKWTYPQKIKVLYALCLTLNNYNHQTLQHLNHLHSECEKLLKLCSKTSFREGDFISIVRNLCGDETAIYCRNLLDGLGEGNDGHAHGVDGLPSSEGLLHSLITEGRCILCNGSTFEDEEEVVEDEGATTNNKNQNKVLLCDGCNAEVHLKCLNLNSVPSSAWYCSQCSERKTKRIQQQEDAVTFNENIDNYRLKEVEDELIDGCAKEKMEGKDPFIATSEDELQCIYCGLNEREVCSPMVMGQSRREHEAWVEMCNQKNLQADNFYKNQKSTTVNFLYAGEYIEPPVLEPPYYPPLYSEEGKLMQKYYDAVSQKPIVAHQLCCLQLFQARVNRSRHALRRRRKMVGSIAVVKTGISTQPLGEDQHGYEYWKYPFSNDLFLLLNPHEFTNSDEKDFNQIIGKYSSSTKHDNDDDQVDGSMKRKKWIRINKTEDIKIIIDLLNENILKEKQLKNNLIQFLLNERISFENQKNQAAAAAALVTASSENSAAPDENEPAASSALNKLDSAGDLSEMAESSEIPQAVNSGFISSRRTKSTDSLLAQQEKEAAINAKNQANIPVALKLFPQKGSEILSNYVIQEERVFDDSIPDEDDNDGNYDEYYQYFTFHQRKYFAIGLVNAQGNLIKNKNEFKVVYQIHKEGLSTPISYAVLAEPWTDHFYYFSTITFKKSGNYTISFLLEGNTSAGSIKPLIFPISVEAKNIKYGLYDALDHLVANQYIDAANRQIIYNKRDLLQFLRVSSTTSPLTPLIACKILLIKLFLALPQGSLSSEVFQTENSLNDPQQQLSLDIMMNHVLEPTSWNSLLEQMWKDSILQANNPLTLMECFLILEFYLNKQWLSNSQSRIFNSLSNPHFAIRSTTSYSTVALRIYALDRCLSYDKVTVAAREKRLSRSEQREREKEKESYYENESNTRRSSRRVDNLVNNNHNNSYEEVSNGNTRAKRSAAITAQARLHQTYQSEDRLDDLVGGEEEEEGRDRSRKLKRQDSNDSYVEEEDEYDDEQEEEDDEDDDNLENEDGDEQIPVNSRQSTWTCSACSYENSARARSCETCGERKPTGNATAAAKSSNSRQSSGRGKRGLKGNRVAPQKKRSRRSEDDEEEEEEFEEEDEEDEEEDDEDGSDTGRRRSRRSSSRRSSSPTSARRSSRQHAKKSYSEVSSGDDDEDDRRRKPKAKQVARGWGRPAGKRRRRDDSDEDDDDEEEEEEEEESESDDDNEDKDDDDDEQDDDNENNDGGDGDDNDDEEKIEKTFDEFVQEKLEEIAMKIEEWKNNDNGDDPSICDQNIRFLSILRSFLNDSRTEVFWEPVNVEEVPSYTSFVKEPMDLGTILDRVLQNEYQGDVERFRSDVNLVWSNCMTYNLEHSELYLIAEEALNVFEEQVNNWILSEDKPSDPDIESS